ncbi:helix-turn-helix domain-containing protein [Haloechinothrix sp. LS1_15]|uniref:PucR family transcriptional regulator n=1 Tax=Haloechinothrix sp. LS1_15 TaxID=2652248 RepID=UPI00294B61D6|nr:helix-turn-helix domain-containing protein [Haloechinothrix sp. LS1_15]
MHSPKQRQHGLRLTSIDPQAVFAAVPKAQLENYIRPMANRMIKDIIQEVRKAVPEYAQPLEGEFGKILVTCVEKSVLQVVDNLGRSEVDKSEWRDWFRYVGKVEYHEGRTLDALHKSVRVGARVAWRHVHAAGMAVGIPSNTLFALADAIFGYTDELCSVAVAGYTEAQAHATGTYARRRHQLLRLLLSDQPASTTSIDELAAATHWPVPERAAAVALEFHEDQYRYCTHVLHPDVLVDLESQEPCLVLADPEAHVEQLGQLLGDRRAAVGPVVPLADVHRSLLTARHALDLVQRGALPDTPILWCEQHLANLLLFNNEFLLSQLSERALEPFDSLTPKQRSRLSSTLLSWLQNRESVNDTARQLGVHPQTVRYRMQQVNKLLGDKLDDPDQRLMIEIALRTLRNLGTERDARRASSAAG